MSASQAPVLRLEHLGKSYRVYDSRLGRLRELLLGQRRSREFAALSGVNLELPPGQCLGVVGDNGSGKSTLLQLIAGTLTPTAGRVHSVGTVLGLLELGVGFHPEFTGRQNISFYGDVLGIPPKFLRSKIDDIIAFSELGEFIERPIKTYSTGMVVRLAFSTITLLEPDILIIDEALSVGDAHFQKKCIDHILAFKRSGKTIIFCSHSTYQISLLCEQTLWLKQGKVHALGDTEHVIPAYEAYQLSRGTEFGSEQGERAAPVRVVSVEILNDLPVSTGADLKIRIRTDSHTPGLRYHLALSIKFGSDLGVFATGTHMQGQAPLDGSREIVVTYPGVPLLGGVYWLHARVLDEHGLLVFHEKVMAEPALEVRKESHERGVCRFENRWEIR